jgi:prepilin-type N-terminal cleavage/methylation domain-containing protein
MKKLSWKRTNRIEGFTIIELMVVIMVIGILVVIAVPRIQNSLERTKEAACLANQKAINEAIQKWQLENGTVEAPFPLDIQQLVNDGLLNSVPKCNGTVFTTIDSNGKTVCPDGGRHILH